MLGGVENDERGYGVVIKDGLQLAETAGLGGVFVEGEVGLGSRSLET